MEHAPCEWLVKDSSISLSIKSCSKRKCKIYTGSGHPLETLYGLFDEPSAAVLASAEDFLGLTGLQSPSWKCLCNCLEKTDTERRKVLSLLSQEERESFADSTGFDIQTLHQGVSYGTLLCTASLLHFVTSTLRNPPPHESLWDKINPFKVHGLESHIHNLHGNSILPDLFDSSVCALLTETTHPPVVFAVTQEEGLHTRAGTRPEQFIPFTLLVLRHLMSQDLIPLHGWAVLFDLHRNMMDPHSLDIDADRAHALERAYTNIEQDVHSVFIVFEDEIPIATVAAHDVEVPIRPLSILIMRDPGYNNAVAFTALDFYWANAVAQGSHIARKLLNFMGHVASIVGVRSFTVIVPEFFLDFWDKDLQPALDTEFYNGYDKKKRQFEREDGSVIDVWFGFAAHRGTKLFQMSSCIEEILRGDLTSSGSGKEPHPSHLPTPLDDFVADSAYLRSDRWTHAIFEPVMYIATYLRGLHEKKPLSSAKDAFTEDIQKFMRSAAVSLNTHLFACILVGAYLLPPPIVHYLLSLKTSKDSLFYLVDGRDNRPSDVYTYCLTKNAGQVHVHSLKCSVLNERQGWPFSATCCFSIERTRFEDHVDFKKTTSFLRSLKRRAYQSSNGADNPTSAPVSETKRKQEHMRQMNKYRLAYIHRHSKVTEGMLDRVMVLLDKLPAPSNLAREYLKIDEDEIDHIAAGSYSRPWGCLCDAVMCYIIPKVDTISKRFQREDLGNCNDVDTLLHHVELFSMETLPHTMETMSDYVTTHLNKASFEDMHEISFLFYVMLERHYQKTGGISSAFLHLLDSMRFGQNISLHFARPNLLKGHSPILGYSTTLEVDRDNGVSGYQLYPFLTLMVRRFLMLDLVPPTKWAVLYDISHSTFPIDEPFSEKFLENLKESTSLMRKSVEKVFIMIRFQLDEEYAGSTTDDLMQLWILYLPDPGADRPRKPKITYLSRCWADRKFDIAQHHLVNRLQEIGAHIKPEGTEMTICIPSTNLKPEVELTEKQRVKQGLLRRIVPEDKSIPAWLRMLLTTVLKYPEDLFLHPASHEASSDDLAAEVLSGGALARDKTYISKFYDHVIYLLLAIKEIDNHDEQNLIIRRCVTDMRQTMATVNLNMAACVLKGDFLCSRYQLKRALFRFGEEKAANDPKYQNRVLRFEKIDGQSFQPPSIYCFAMGSRGKKPVVSAIIHGIQAHGNDFRDIFTVKTLNFSPNIKEPITFIDTLCEMAHESHKGRS